MTRPGQEARGFFRARRPESLRREDKLQSKRFARVLATVGVSAAAAAAGLAMPLLVTERASAASASDSQPFEINVTHGLGAGEPEIAVDPVRHVVALSIMFSNPADGSSTSECGYAVSHDEGNTWRLHTTHPADPGFSSNDFNHHVCSDPVAASGAAGAMYLGAEWAHPFLNAYVSGSNDGGLTWGPSVYATGMSDTVTNVEAAPNTGVDDRPWLTADSQTGTVYATMADFVPRLRHWIVASHDQGRTFGPPHAIAPNTAPELAASDFIPSAANGVLADSYVTSALDPSCLCRNVFETSRDDEVTWTRTAAPIPAQWTAADPSHPGRFAIMSGGMDVTDWQSFNQNELLVSVTSDYGRTWSAPVAIGQDPPNPRYMPWIAYGPTGALGVSYRTKYGANPCVPDNCPETSYDMWAAVSRDGGFYFDPPVRISHALSAPQITSGSGFAAGDDFGTVALDDKYLYVAWGDMRENPDSSASGAQRSVYFGRVPLGGG